MADIEKKVKITVTDDGQLKKTSKEIDGLNKSIDKNNKSNKKGSKSSRELDRNMKGLANMSSNVSKNFSKQAQGMQGVLVPAYAEVAARVFALTAAYGALSRAADFGILMQGQELYAQQTGKNLSQIAKNLQEASGFMLDFKEASAGAALATTAGLNVDQLKDITTVAKGAAAALGRSLPDAYDRLVRGIVKGEPEILDELGLIIRLDKVYKDFADRLGKTSAELTEYQKLQARQQAVIEQQGLTKFGGIAEAIPANEFERLRASATDLLNTLSQGITGIFGPVAKFLSEAELALGLIFAMITKSLATKIFPALEGIGKRFNEIPENLEKRIDRLNKRIEKSKAVGTQQIAAAATRSRMESNIAKIVREQGSKVKPGTTLYRAFGLLENGKPNRQVVNQIKSQWSRIYKGAVKAVGADGIITRGQLAGQNIKDVEIANKQMDILAQRQGKVAALFRVMTASASGFINRVGIGFNRVVLGAFTSLEGVIKRVVALASNLGRVLSKALAALAVVQVVSFLGDLVFGLSRTFVKAKESAENFADSTKSALDAVQNTKVDLKELNIAGSFEKILAASTFRKNIAEQLSTSFNSAIENLNFKAESVSGGFAKFIDLFKTIFGAGIVDALGEGIAQGLGALSGTGYKFDDNLIKRLQNYYKILTQEQAEALRAGRQLGQGDIVQIEAAATAQGLTFSKDIINLIGSAIADNTEKQRAFNAAIQAANDSAERLEKTLGDLAKGFKVKTSFDEIVTAFDASVKAIKDVERQFKPEVILKNFGAINPQLKLLQDATEDFALQEKELIRVRATGNKQAIREQEIRLESARKEKNLAKELALSTVDYIDPASAGAKSLGFDPKAAQTQELLYLERKQAIAQKLKLIESDSFNAIKQQKILGIETLENDKKILVNKLNALDAVKGTKRDEQSIKDLKAQIANLDSQIAVSSADNMATIAFTQKLLGEEVTLRQKIVNLINQQKASGRFTQEEMLADQQSRVLAAQIKQTDQAMKNITEDFKDAIASVATAFKDSVSDALVDYLNGTNTADIRQSLGESLTKQGADIAAGVVSNAVFGRSGLLGSALDFMGLGGLADDLIPRTQLEIAQEDLKVQREMLEMMKQERALGFLDFNGGNGGGFSLFDLFGNGGIAKGGFKMYANGGIATQPHMGIIGEGKYNEAIVPLPDGKSIPVIGNTGGNTNNISVSVSIDSNGAANSETTGAGSDKQGKELAYQISQAVQEEILMQQRPGGLLNGDGGRTYG